MNIKPVLAAVALATGLAMSSSAMAFSLGGYAGAVKMEFGNLDAGTTGYTGACGGTSASAANIAACDSVAGILPAPGGIGSEDTWAIFSISKIVTDNPANTTLWTAGDGGEFLTGILYGLMDYNVNVSPQIDPFTLLPTSTNNVATMATSGFVDLWLQSVDYDGSLGPTGRTAANAYPTTATGPAGSEFLKLAFDIGASASAVGTNARYVTTYTDTETSGNGQGYLSVLGGTHASMFDNDSFTNKQGGISDMFLTTTFDNSNGNATPWTASSSGQAKAQVAEPASIALMGLGLLGLGAAARRKKSA